MQTINMSWKGGGGYIVEGSIQKSPSEETGFLQESSAMNFLCLNHGLLTVNLDYFLLPTAKSLDIDNCCIARATVMLTHLHTLVWAILLEHDLKIFPWQQNFCICLLSGCSLH